MALCGFVKVCKQTVESARNNDARAPGTVRTIVNSMVKLHVLAASVE